MRIDVPHLIISVRWCVERVISLAARPIRVVHRPLLRSAGVIHNQLLARRNRHEARPLSCHWWLRLLRSNVVFRALRGLAAAERWVSRPAASPRTLQR